MPEFDIDSLKKTWQNQPAEERYDQKQILSMLNHRSRNYVKYIFWISAGEFLVFLVLGVLYVFQSEEDNSLITILQKIGVRKTFELQMDFEHLYFLMKVLSLVVTGYFAVSFYRNYRKISVEENLKLLIERIIRFRKTISHYITANFILIFLYIGGLMLFIYKVLNLQQIQLSNPTLVGFITGIVATSIISFVLLWVYYRLVYGIINRRLGKNLEQLKDIERQKN